nr:DUF4920 domain-containing protein [uncultured Pedobacter sp.]
MKKLLIYFLLPLIMAFGCQNGNKIKLRAPQAIKGVLIGDSVLDNNIKDSESVLAIIVPDNTTKVKLRGVVKKVSKKGNWLQMTANNKKEILVNFGDKAIFFPQSMTGKEVVLDGQAKLETLSVEQQKSFAIENEIAPKQSSSIKGFKEVVLFEAKGVVIL